MKISVVICTSDRAASLERTLESIAAAAAPLHSAWEVVVVNNGSSDDTDRVVERFGARLPVQRVFEPIRGLSAARNAGVAAATGDYFVWTDDDVRVSVAWLQAYECAFTRCPSAVFFGGPIRPRFLGTPPAWLTSGLPYVLGAYAGLDHSAHEVTLGTHADQRVYGANMAIRGVEQRRLRYDLRLGRQPTWDLLNGEDGDILRRLVAAGATGVWLPDAAVEHWIDAPRQTVAYLRRYYRGGGATQGVKALLNGHELAWHDLPALAAGVAWHQAVYVVGRLLVRPDIWLPALVKSSHCRGRLHVRRRGLLGDAREAAS